MKKNTNASVKKISRRDFLRGTAAAGAAAMFSSLTGCAAAGDSTTAPIDTTQAVTAAETIETQAPAAPDSTPAWDYETDVLVAGSGGGLLAACDAADAGCEVLLIEKASFLGGECIMNEGWQNGAGTSLQASHNVVDNAETFAADWAINHAATAAGEDPALVQTYMENSGAALDRLMELGCQYVLAQDVQFYGSAPRAHIIQPNASAWATTLQAAAEKRGVTILTNTPLTDLILNENGEVIGVKSGDLKIKARKGVILATGDASGNERMKAKFQPQSAFIPACDPNNTGDGYFAALRVGADSSHTQFTAVGPCQMFQPEGSALNSYALGKGMIIVNNQGQRFANEFDFSGTALAQTAQPEKEAYCLFDSQVAALAHRPEYPVSEILPHFYAGEFFSIGLISGIGPAYLEDFLETGAIVQADTLEELAAKLNVDADGLAEQVASWNAAVQAGVDETFGRPIADDFQFGAMTKIEEGPFYALIFSTDPRWMLTEGPNLMVDTHMNILDSQGSPIPRLYGAGAGLCGGTGTLTLNTCGDHMGFTAVSARLAAASVSALSAWE